MPDPIEAQAPAGADIAVENNAPPRSSDVKSPAAAEPANEPKRLIPPARPMSNKELDKQNNRNNIMTNVATGTFGLVAGALGGPVVAIVMLMMLKFGEHQLLKKRLFPYQQKNDVATLNQFVDRLNECIQRNDPAAAAALLEHALVRGLDPKKVAEYVAQCAQNFKGADAEAFVKSMNTAVEKAVANAKAPVRATNALGGMDANKVVVDAAKAAEARAQPQPGARSGPNDAGAFQASAASLGPGSSPRFPSVSYPPAATPSPVMPGGTRPAAVAAA